MSTDNINTALTKRAQNLRKNMTKEERHLWYDFLKTLPITVNRQKVLGNYIVDFYCEQAKLVIEIDGSQHCTVDGRMKDEIKKAYFVSNGLTVLRFSNSDIHKKFDGVCEQIWQYIKASVRD